MNSVNNILSNQTNPTESNFQKKKYNPFYYQKKKKDTKPWQHRNLSDSLIPQTKQKPEREAMKRRIKELLSLSFSSLLTDSSPITLKITTTYFFFLNIFQLSKRFTHSPTVQTMKTQRVVKSSFKFKF